MKRLHYGWVMVLGAIGILIVQALTFYSFGIFIRPITEQYHWERGAFSVAMSLLLVVSGPLSMIAGRLSDRYGPRRLLTFSGLLAGVGFLLMSRISHLWQVYVVFGGVIAAGNSASVVPLTSTIPRWFARRRGLALGLTWTGIGLGGVTGALLTQWLIDAFDWRWAYVALGIANFVIFVPLAQLMKSDPSEMGLKPYGAKDGTAEPEPATVAPSATFGGAVKSARFWMAGLSFFSLVFIGQVLGAHLAPHAIDIGIPGTVAASFVSLYAATSLIGRNTCGLITDRAGTRWALLIGFVFITASTVWLLFAKSAWAFYVFSCLYGVGYGTVVPLQTLMPGELFGLRSLGAISAAVMFIGAIGGAIGAPLAGAIFDATGRYQYAFCMCVGVAALAFVLSTFLLRQRLKKT
jgi:MFS family permease